MKRVTLSVLLLLGALVTYSPLSASELSTAPSQVKAIPANPTPAEIAQMKNIAPATSADKMTEGNSVALNGLACPWGYRLVYGYYLALGWYFNGYQYVYGYYYAYGYYCVYP